MPGITSHSAASHALGLKNNPLLTPLSSLVLENEGWDIDSAQKSIKERYKGLTEKELSFDTFSHYNKNTFLSKINPTHKVHGEYSGFSTGWLHHGFSLHTIRDKETTHFIYVNRGQRHHMPNKSNKTPPAVMVYSIPSEEDKVEQFAKNFYSAFSKSVFNFGDFFVRQDASKFINSNQSLINRDLTSKLEKSDQKTGNCTIANSNISWCFQLASNLMKKDETLSFGKAYDMAKEEYKQLRQKDRIAAFTYLLQEKNKYPSQESFYYDFFQGFEKLMEKDRKASGNVSYIHLDQLTQKDSGNQLMELLTHPDFNKYLEVYRQENAKKNKKIDPETIESHKKRFGKIKDIILASLLNEAIEQYTKNIADLELELKNFPSRDDCLDKITQLKTEITTALDIKLNTSSEGNNLETLLKRVIKTSKERLSNQVAEPILSPDLLSPDLLSPDLLSPDRLSPDRLSLDLFNNTHALLLNLNLINKILPPATQLLKKPNDRISKKEFNNILAKIPDKNSIWSKIKATLSVFYNIISKNKTTPSVAQTKHEEFKKNFVAEYKTKLVSLQKKIEVPEIISPPSSWRTKL